MDIYCSALKNTVVCSESSRAGTDILPDGAKHRSKSLINQLHKLFHGLLQHEMKVVLIMMDADHETNYCVAAERQMWEMLRGKGSGKIKLQILGKTLG